jgi:hypothetical protein
MSVVTEVYAEHSRETYAGTERRLITIFKFESGSWI